MGTMLIRISGCNAVRQLRAALAGQGSMPIQLQGLPIQGGQLILIPADRLQAMPMGEPAGLQLPQAGFPMMQAMGAAPEPEAAREDVLKLVNQERAKVGLGPLSLDENLNTAAQGHSEDMAKRDFFNHVNPDGKDPFQRMAEAGAQGVGENIAMGQLSAEQVVQSWMESPGHRRAILNPNATKMGLGIAEGGGMPRWTQTFGV